MAELTNAVNELLKGRHFDDNFPVYYKGLTSLYRRMAMLRLSMNYYTFSEMFYDLNKEQQDTIKPYVDRVQNLVMKITDRTAGIDNRDEAENLRNDLIRIMEILTSYTDKFQIYEYILNRIEFRFKEPEFNNLYYTGKFEKDIAHYVVSDKDNSVVNMKISMVVSQLPMRLSKNKFFDMIKDAFSLYKDSEKLSVRDFSYMLKTAGTIYRPDGFEKEFAEFEKIDKELSEAPYEDFDKVAYELFRDKLDNVSAMVMEYADIYVVLTEIVNDIYSLLLCDGAYTDVNEEEKLLNIIGESCRVISGVSSPDPEWAEKFSEFEGLQEKIGGMIYYPESTLDEIKSINEKEFSKPELRDKADILDTISKLQSASTFASLKHNEDDHETAGEEFVAEAVEELVKEFSELFEQKGKLYRRAVMASVIGNLPNFFNSMDEFAKYVHVALGQCSEPAEQQACMSLIHMMIAGDE